MSDTNDNCNLFRKTAKYYDYDNRDNLTVDIPFYIEYAQKTGNEILELGCGTGRVAIPLAQKGFNVTGLDLSDDMLDIFKEKLRKIPENEKNRITYIKGDMSNFLFDKKFDMIIAPFRAFQALTEETDINNCLKCVNEHLSDNGVFIVNVFRPRKVLDESWCYPETLQWETVDNEAGFKITKKHWGDRIDVEKQIIYPNFIYEKIKILKTETETEIAITNKEIIVERIEEKLALKYYYYHQLKDYLKNNGLDVIEEYGWYDKSDIENGRELIFVCRRSSV